MSLSGGDNKLEIKTELDTSGVSTGMSSIGSMAKSGMKATAAAIGVATVAVAGLVTASVKAYASYEQLVGGVDTLFKESSSKIQEYAANAYRTAGLSANQYMETVTGFSASLLQSLGGDTEKAADYANQAVIDMSDNANKMGTNMQDIQNAYQGFAKQNYTMLDNLKLGYGGTKEEMQRLLDDAEKISGIHYDISNYADVTQAIHVMQESMGIAGTTAEEAAKTIEGSVNATKAAWSNLLVGMADDNADFGQLIDNFVESATNAFSNILPRVEQALAGAGELVSKLLPVIVDGIPGLIDTVLPRLFESGTNMIMAIVKGLSQNMPQIVKSAMDIIIKFVKSLSELLPEIIQAITDMMPELVATITENLPILIQAIMDLIPLLLQALLDALPQLIEAGLQIVLGLIQGLVQAIPQLIAMIPQIITGIINAIAQAIPMLIEYAPQIILALIQGIISAIPQLLMAIPQIIGALISGLGTAASGLIEVGGRFVRWLWNGVSGAIGGFFRDIWSFAKSIPGKIADGIGNIAEVGKNVIKGFWNGISDAKDWLVRKISGFFGGIKESICDFFDIHSPSRWAKRIVGNNIVYGIGNGIVEKAKYAINAVKSLSGKVKAAFVDNMADFETNLAVTSSADLGNGIAATPNPLNLISSGGEANDGTMSVAQTIIFNQPVKSPAETARAVREEAVKLGLAG